MKRLFVLALSLAQALGVMVPAGDNKDWSLDGHTSVFKTNQSCQQLTKALLLSPGASATYRFNGTAVVVWGGMYDDGAEALIEFEGQQRPVNADSRNVQCWNFASFNGLDATKLHTIRISVPGGGQRGVFPLMGLNVTPPLGSIPPPSSPSPPSPPATPTPTPSSSSPSTGETSTNSEPDAPSSSTNPEPSGSSSSTTRESTRPSSSSTDSKGSTANTSTEDDLPESTSGSSVAPTNGTPQPVGGSTETTDNTSPSDSPSPDNDQSNFTATSSGPKASTIVPAVLVPLLVIGGVLFALWFMRRRRQARIPPSAAFRMANPGYGESGETMTETQPGWHNGAGGGERQVWSPFPEDGGQRY